MVSKSSGHPAAPHYCLHIVLLDDIGQTAKICVLLKHSVSFLRNKNFILWKDNKKDPTVAQPLTFKKLFQACWVTSVTNFSHLLGLLDLIYSKTMGLCLLADTIKCPSWIKLIQDWELQAHPNSDKKKTKMKKTTTLYYSSDYKKCILQTLLYKVTYIGEE